MQTDDFYASTSWYKPSQGSRYWQLYLHIRSAIVDGRLASGKQLPPERELAELADVSRVTVRKAIAELVHEGMVAQQRGSGSYIKKPAPKLETSLSSLSSFTETIHARGKKASSKVLHHGLFIPTPEEMVSLGIAAHQRVARVERLRIANGIAMAIEKSSLPEDILPHPDKVTTSLYAVLRENNCAPIRAIQRLGAAKVSVDQAALLQLEQGAALLTVERTAFLANGRPIEITRGFYRPDIYDFIAELRLEKTN